MRLKRDFSRILVITLVITFSISFVFAATITDDIHLNIQTTNSTGGIVTGTFDFVFNISTSSTCTPVIYTNSTTLTTDTRGIISYYLPSVTLNYDEQYYLCYYRDGALKDSSKIARTPYSFRAQNITLSGVEIDQNLEMGAYNITTTGTGFFGFLGSLASRISKLFVVDVDFSGSIVGTGNITTTGNITADYIGVGTTTPSQRLDVAGGIQIGYTPIEEEGAIRYQTSTKQFEAYNGTDWNSFGSSGSGSLWGQSGSNLYYNNGNVGIGTIDPNATLHVVGEANITGNLTVGGNVTFEGSILSGSGATSGGILNEPVSNTNPTLIPNKGMPDYGIGYGSQSLHLIANSIDVVEITASQVNFTQNTSFYKNVTGTAYGSWGLVNVQSVSNVPSILPKKEEPGYGLGYGSSSVHLIAGETNVLEVTPSQIIGWKPANFTSNVTFGGNSGDILSGNLYGSGAILNKQATSNIPSILPKKEETGYGLGYGSSSLHLIANGANVVEVTDSEVTFSENVSMVKNLSVDGYVGIGTTSPGAKLDVAGSIRAWSGLVGTGSYLGLGRTANEGTFALSSGNDQYAVGSVAGDIILRTDTTSQKLILNSGPGAATLVVNNGNVGIGTTAPLSKLAINGGLHVGGDSDAGDNNLLVDGTATAGGFTTSGVTETGDHGAAATDQVVNVCYGTGAPPDPATMTEGALWVKYTA